MGYVGEDCLRKGEKALKHKNFMIYRIVIDGRLEGAVYLWKDEHAQETDTALLMAIALRRRAQVDYDGLLAGIEKKIPTILKEAKAQRVLISTDTSHMGNNPNVVGAIQRRWGKEVEDRKVNPDMPNASYYDANLFKDGEYFVVPRNEGLDPPANSSPEGDPAEMPVTLTIPEEVPVTLSISKADRAWIQEIYRARPQIQLEEAFEKAQFSEVQIRDLLKKIEEKARGGFWAAAHFLPIALSGIMEEYPEWGADGRAYGLVTLLAENTGEDMQYAYAYITVALKGMKKNYKDWGPDKAYELATFLAEKTRRNVGFVYGVIPTVLKGISDNYPEWGPKKAYQLVTFLAEKEGGKVGVTFHRLPTSLQFFKDYFLDKEEQPDSNQSFELVLKLAEQGGLSLLDVTVFQDLLSSILQDFPSLAVLARKENVPDTDPSDDDDGDGGEGGPGTPPIAGGSVPTSENASGIGAMHQKALQVFADILDSIWGNEKNPKSMWRPHRVERTDQLHRTMKMAAIMLDRVKSEKGVQDNHQVTVIVAGCKDNIIEADVWLELGAKVVIKEIAFIDELRALKKAAPEKYRNLEIEGPDGPTKTGDIVVWTHPHPIHDSSIYKRPTIRLSQLLDYSLKDGGPATLLLLVQTDEVKFRRFIESSRHHPNASIRGYGYEVIFSSDISVNNGDYFLPTNYNGSGTFHVLTPRFEEPGPVKGEKGKGTLFVSGDREAAVKEAARGGGGSGTTSMIMDDITAIFDDYDPAMAVGIPYLEDGRVAQLSGDLLICNMSGGPRSGDLSLHKRGEGRRRGEEPHVSLEVFEEGGEEVDDAEIENVADAELVSEGGEVSSGGVIEGAHLLAATGPKLASPAMSARILIHKF